MNKTVILQKLEEHGGRITPLREMLVAMFSTAKKPLSVPEILTMLESLGSQVNKTSVYRQIQLFLKLNIVKELQLQKNSVHYELANFEHHHHLICNHCKKIEHIDVQNIEEHICRMEKETLNKKGFEITSHVLDFYGLCQKCSLK